MKKQWKSNYFLSASFENSLYVFEKEEFNKTSESVGCNSCEDKKMVYNEDMIGESTEIIGKRWM